MEEVQGNIWDWHDQGHYIAIPTNGCVNARGQAIMGCGLALQAKRLYRELPKELAERLGKHGNKCFVFPKMRLVTIPTKDDYRADSSLPQIIRSCIQLDDLMEEYNIPILYIPRLGCGAGRLVWDDVKPVVEGCILRSLVVAVTPL